MSPERFRRIEEQYHATREGTPDERAALLAQTDPELRREAPSIAVSLALWWGLRRPQATQASLESDPAN